MTLRIEPNAEPIPGYRLIDRLGRGGFGEVWRAEAPGGLQKAIKFVYGDIQDEMDAGRERAEQELKALARVKSVRHPYILSLERYEIVDGRLVVVMELADKNMWDRYKECRAQGLPGIPRAELLHYMLETAEALDMMNKEYDLQHLDIKPQNIFLVHQHVKVADFGLVKDMEGFRASMTGGVTPIYAAPETFDGWVSRYCDQYSLAICYQEMLTGHRPFNGTNVRQLIFQHLQGVPDLSPLPESDHSILARSLAKKPDDRYPTTMEMVQALLRAEQPVEADPAGSYSLPSPVSGIPPVLDDSGSFSTDVQIRSLTQEERRGEEGRRGGGEEEKRSSVAGVEQQADACSPAPFLASTPLVSPRLECEVPREITGEGVLFPALVIAVGKTGMEVLQRFKQCLNDELGDPPLSSLRMLLIDVDPEIVRDATHSHHSRPFAPHEILLTPLQRPGKYLRQRQDKPSLERWLPSQMLYRIPRSLHTSGVRALGRLAFCDNYRSVVRRLRQELGECTNADTLARMEQNPLGLRTSYPRVYLVANLAGGAGGMVIDLAYTIRSLLREAGYEHPDIVGHFFVPNPISGLRVPESGVSAPFVTPQALLALGNTHAALRELDHFSQPHNVFTGIYHEKDPPVEERGPAFRRCVLSPLVLDRGTRQATLDRVAQVLLQETCTPLGKLLDSVRAEVPPPPDREPGSRQVLFAQAVGLRRLQPPHRVLLEEMAIEMCVRIVSRWISKKAPEAKEPVKAFVEKQAREALNPESFLRELRESTCKKVRQEPEGALRAVTEPLVRRYMSKKKPPRGVGQRAAALLARRKVEEIPFEEVDKVLSQLQALVGTPVQEFMSISGGQASNLVETPPVGTIEDAVRRSGVTLLEDRLQRLTDDTVTLIEDPAFRLAGAELALRGMVDQIQKTLEQYEQLADGLASQAANAHERLQCVIVPPPETPTEDPASVGLLRRDRRNTMELELVRKEHLVLAPAEVIELLCAYGKWRWQALLAAELCRALISLRGHLVEELREVDGCRTRLVQLLHRFKARQPLDEEAQEVGDSGLSTQLLLPAGTKRLHEAVDRFMQELPEHHIGELDLHMEAMIQERFAALVHFCLAPEDGTANMEQAMIETAKEYLAALYPHRDAASIILEQSDRKRLLDQLDDLFENAAPVRSLESEIRGQESVVKKSAVKTQKMSGRSGVNELCVLAVPDGEAGEQIRDQARELFADITLHFAASSSDLLVYREQPCLPMSSFLPGGEIGDQAYQQLVNTEHFTPHTRVDVDFTSENFDPE